jgi:hypothetical protein
MEFYILYIYTSCHGDYPMREYKVVDNIAQLDYHHMLASDLVLISKNQSKGWCLPSVVCWFIAPMNYFDISTINPRCWSCL